MPRPVARRLRAFVLLFLSTLAAPAIADVPPAPQWDHDETLHSAEGYVQLRWTVEVEDPDAHWIYQLQEGQLPVFADTDTRYDGAQTSSFVSGLEDGTTYFRVRARPADEPEAWSAWSTTVEVDVKHHDRSFALLLMGIGGFVFLATAAFLIAHRNDPAPTGGRS